ncbi:hypothetical protein BDV18DRAFT_128347 [Aspergillus unguis]
MGEAKSSVGVKVYENGAPIEGKTLGNRSRRWDVVKSVSKTSRGYNVTREQKVGCVSRCDGAFGTKESQRLAAEGLMTRKPQKRGMRDFPRYLSLRDLIEEPAVSFGGSRRCMRYLFLGVGRSKDLRQWWVQIFNDGAWRD